MKDVLGGEYARLQSLRKRNGVVSVEELRLIEEEITLLTKAIGESAVRLDGVRLIRMKA